MNLNVFTLIIWTILGIVNLSIEEISKFQYAVAWLSLMSILVLKCIEQ